MGYGDTYPDTLVGRGVATFLMLVGIGRFGPLTANVAAYFVESGPDRSDEADAGSLDEMLAELRRLHDRLDAAGLAADACLLHRGKRGALRERLGRSSRGPDGPGSQLRGRLVCARGLRSGEGSGLQQAGAVEAYP